MLEKTISNLIQNQFPEVFRENGPDFISFVTEYYKWMETANNALYYSRNFPELHDIDETVDDFVIYFKEKYLKNIQFSTVASTRTMVKHSLDLYRSKGTERGLDLFFRSVYGTSSEVYYPGDDVFKLSSGKWVIPRYIEVSFSVNNRLFENKQIVGLTSGATAFCERYVRKKISSKYINIFYVSAINGNFQTGEVITIDGMTMKDSPTMVGSLTSLQVFSGGESFKIGDRVTLTGGSGYQGIRTCRQHDECYWYRELQFNRWGLGLYDKCPGYYL